MASGTGNQEQKEEGKTMKPREELIKDIFASFAQLEVGEISRDDADMFALMAVNRMAIGRWVSVEERLPEFKGGYWSGYMVDDGRTDYGIRSEAWFYTGNTTHWLELDMPEGGVE